LAHVILLIGCGTETQIEIKEVIKPVPQPFYIDTAKIDAPLVPHVMEFAGYCEKFKISELCKNNFKNITSIRMVKSFKEKFVVGKCYVSSIGDRWVEVLSDWIDRRLNANENFGNARSRSLCFGKPVSSL